jgi:hypothetical protein
MRPLSVLLVFAALAGCADTYKISPTGFYDWPISLDGSGSAYVALASDGNYQGDVYQGSGRVTTQIVAAAFTPYLRNVVAGLEEETFVDAIVTARSKGLSYLLYPAIRHWEDRATAWSGRPDVVAVELSLVELRSEKMLDSVLIQGQSKEATLAGNRPEDLLREPVREYAKSLFK